MMQDANEQLMRDPRPRASPQLKPTSIETEVFPHMAKEGQLHAIPLQGFWADVGQPKDFITGTALYLTSLASLHPERLLGAKPPTDAATPVPTEYEVVGNVLMHPTAKIGPGSKIGPNVVIGPRCVVGSGVRLDNCVLMEGSIIKQVRGARVVCCLLCDV
jgi:mannose-1-phosphate guanylyltransferase